MARAPRRRRVRGVRAARDRPARGAPCSRRSSTGSTPTWRSAATPTLVAELEGLVARAPAARAPARAAHGRAVPLRPPGGRPRGLRRGAARAARRARRRARPRAARPPGGDPAPGPRARAGAEPVAGPARPPPRRIALLAVGGALLVGAAVGGGRLLAGSDPDRSARRSAQTRRGDRPRRRRGNPTPVDVGPSPSHLAADGRTLWVTQRRWRSVSRVDLDGRAACARRSPSAAAPPAWPSPPGAVWVANSRDGTVSRIDASTNTSCRHIPVGTNPTGVAAGAGRCGWRTPASRRSRGSTRTAEAGDQIDVHAAPTEIAVGAGAVWMTSSSTRTVSQLDPRSGRVVEVDPGGRRAERHRGRPRRRVGRQQPGRHRLADRPATAVVTDDPGRERADAIVVGRVACGSAEQFGDGVARIDPDTDRVVKRIRSETARPGSLLAGGALWVATRASGAEHRGGTLRVLAQTAVFDALDPALAYAPGSTAIVGLTGDGLTAMQRAAGRDAAQVVPDLAVTLPTAPGRRPHLPVCAAPRHPVLDRRRGARHRRPALVRADLEAAPPFADFTSPGRDFFADIVGADQCRRKPRTCDLSRGIVTEPGNDAVVTFHLLVPTRSSFTNSRSTRLHPAGGNAAARCRRRGPCPPPAHTPWRALTEATRSC